VDVELYIKWMRKLKSWLENYKDVVKELERKYESSILKHKDVVKAPEHKYESSILKLIDEGLYIMCSVNLQIRVSKLGIISTF